MNNKKEFALIFGITDNYAFALGNVLIGLKKYCKKINFDIFVYHQNLNENDKHLLSSTIECNFIEYSFPQINKIMQESSSIWLNKFSELAFSRYEAFDYLNDYKKVAWLDVDILIKNDIQSLFDECKQDVALFPEINDFKGLFLNVTDNIDVSQPFYYNSGILVIADTLLNKGNIKEWCYKRTVELADIIKLPDQAILNLMLQEFTNITVSDLDKNFNCLPTDKDSKDAVILHSRNSEKFWNFYSIKEWNKNNKEWIKMGGTPYKGPKASFLNKLIKPYFPAAPDPLRRPRDFFKYIYNEIKKKND